MTSVPDNYSLSYVGTPSLTINHDVTQDLDSSNAFEGPEKLLELWFAPDANALPASAHPTGLKMVSAATWETMLDLVHCKILSIVQSESVDAYLLSESSLFVFPHKVILKTCGTTTLLLGLKRLLNIAAVEAGFPVHEGETEVGKGPEALEATPYRVFYSRKNFLFPEKQRGPHRSWKEEVKFLDDTFDGGSAYMVGKMNGDHWYLYLTSPANVLTPPPGSDSTLTVSGARIPVGSPALFNGRYRDWNDETLEILMTDLDPESAKQFYLSHASAVAQDKKKTVSGTIGGDMIREEEGEDDEMDVFDNGHGGKDLLSSDEEEEMKETPSVLMDSGIVVDSADALPISEGHALGTVVAETCGLADVYPKHEYPDARVDAYLFAPCGFSANGVIPAVGVDDVAAAASKEADDHDQTTDTTKKVSSGHYFTVHVTPEPNCSFASFETNVPLAQSGKTTSEMIHQVVDIFKPGRFSVTFFEARKKLGDHAEDEASFQDKTQPQTGGQQSPLSPYLPGYRRVDHIIHQFEDYNLVFRFYQRVDWAGSSTARLGDECC